METFEGNAKMRIVCPVKPGDCPRGIEEKVELGCVDSENAIVMILDERNHVVARGKFVPLPVVEEPAAAEKTAGPVAETGSDEGAGQ